MSPLQTDRSAYVGRFAPSPTGPLHFGSLHAAVVSWLDARCAGGRWLLRIEDLDPPRSVAGASDDIQRSLEAHGLRWDDTVTFQSNNDARYEAAFEALRAHGLLFRCICTRQAIRVAGGRYPGTCRERGMIEDGQAAAVRIRVNDCIVRFEDRHAGPVSQQLAQDPGDFILRRKDGLWAYQLAVVVDDADAGVTDVVRGMDLLDSTPRQIWLQQTLGLPTPSYLHHHLVLHADGSKLSKQTGAPGLDDRLASRNLARVLGFLGLPHDPGASPTEQLAEAVQAFSPDRLPNRDTVADGAASQAPGFC